MAAFDRPTGQSWKPNRNVELVAASAAGGGSDNLARLVQKIIQEQKIIDVPLTVMNKPASGGVVAWMGLNQNPMDGHHLSISTELFHLRNIVELSRQSNCV